MTTAELMRRNVVMPDGNHREFTLFDDHYTNMAFEDVLSGRSYPIFDGLFPVNRILDMGANVGSAALYFHTRYPTAYIECYEPFHLSFDLLEQNTQGLHITCHNAAVSNHNGTRQLCGSGVGPVGYSITRQGKQSIEVDVVAGGPLIAAFAPDILKLDVEGSELDILRCTPQEALARISVVYIEYHSEEIRRDLDRLLPEHVMFHARVGQPFQGEIAYIRRDLT